MLAEQGSVARMVVVVDLTRCLGCGQCVRSCPQGALAMEGQAVALASPARCRGNGSCLGHCSADALSVAERPAQPYTGRAGPAGSCVSW